MAYARSALLKMYSPVYLVPVADLKSVIVASHVTGVAWLVMHRISDIVDTRVLANGSQEKEYALDLAISIEITQLNRIPYIGQHVVSDCDPVLWLHAGV